MQRSQSRRSDTSEAELDGIGKQNYINKIST